MSVISNRHSVVLFTAGTSTALTGQRLAKVGYKSTKNTPAKFKSVCASIPSATLTDEQCVRMKDQVTELFHAAQDNIFKSLYESSNGKLEAITDEDISFEAVLGYLEAESTGGRLTKESVVDWFNTHAAETTMALLAEKLGYSDELTQEQMDTIEKHTNGYREVFASLSGGKTMLQPKQINGLRKVLGMIESPETDVQMKLVKRLDVMEKSLIAQTALADIL